MKSLLWGAILGLFLTSCTKENDTLGLSDEEDGSLFSSSTKDIELKIFSNLPDSVVSSSNEQVFIGGFNSIESGLLSHSTFSSLIPNDFSFRIPEGGITVNQVYLNFEIDEFYGTAVSQGFDVKLLEKAVSENGTYYTHNRFATKDSTYGQFTLTGTDSTLSVELDTSIVMDILNAGNASFTTADVFVEIFKGIAIVPNSSPQVNEGGTYTIDPTSIELELNYTENEAGTEGTLTFETENRSFYNSTWDGNGELADHLDDELLGKKEIILRGAGGANAQIDFLDLKEWYDQGNVLINKAILQLTYQGSENEDLVLPSSLVFHQLNSSSSTGVQGVYSSETRNYEFNIEPLLTENLSNDGSMSFELSLQNSGSNPEQLLLMGTESEYTPVSLEIFFTNH